LIWRACRCRENELVSTRDLGTGSLLSTFSVGRTGVVEGGGSGGEEWTMTRLRLAPRSLWGPLGPAQSSPPLPATDFFYPLSSPSCSLFCSFIYFLFFIFSPSLPVFKSMPSYKGDNRLRVCTRLSFFRPFSDIRGDQAKGL